MSVGKWMFAHSNGVTATGAKSHKIFHLIKFGVNMKHKMLTSSFRWISTCILLGICLFSLQLGWEQPSSFSGGFWKRQRAVTPKRCSSWRDFCLLAHKWHLHRWLRNVTLFCWPYLHCTGQKVPRQTPEQDAVKFLFAGQMLMCIPFSDHGKPVA